MRFGRSIITLTAVVVVILLSIPAHADPYFPGSYKPGGYSSGQDPSTVALPKSPRPITVSPAKAAHGPIGPTTNTVVKVYLRTRNESISTITTVVVKPPKDPAKARAQLARAAVVAQKKLMAVYAAISKQRKSSKRAKTGPAGFNLRAERENLMRLISLARQALEHQLQTARTRAALEKALEDAPRLVKAMVAELRSIDDQVKGFLAKVTKTADQRMQERTLQYIQIVGANVQHVWENIVKNGKTIFGKKEYQPGELRKRMERVFTSMSDQVSHLVAGPTPYQQAVLRMRQGLKTSQELYKRIYMQCQKAREPITTGSAASSIAIFRGVKPSEIKTRAVGAFVSLIKGGQ